MLTVTLKNTIINNKDAYIFIKDILIKHSMLWPGR